MHETITLMMIYNISVIKISWEAVYVKLSMTKMNNLNTKGKYSNAVRY